MWCCNRYPSKLFLLRLVRGPQSQWETWFVRRRQGFIFWGRKRLQTRILENGSVILLSSSSYFLFFLLQSFLFTIHSKDVQVTKYINNLSTISIRSRTYMYKRRIIWRSVPALCWKAQPLFRNRMWYKSTQFFHNHIFRMLNLSSVHK